MSDTHTRHTEHFNCLSFIHVPLLFVALERLIVREILVAIIFRLIRNTTDGRLGIHAQSL